MEEIEDKRCCKCNEVKPFEAFQNDRTTRDGKKSRCKACTARRKNHNPQPHGEKKCFICQTIKDYSCFGKDASSRDGYAYECKSCKNQRMRQYRPPLTEALKTRQKHYQEQEPIKRKRTERACSRRFRSLGIDLTPDICIAKYNEQNRTCAICGMSETINSIALALDHDHTTGAIRGLLCRKCNGGLGLFRYNPNFLRKAAVYLEKYSSNSQNGDPGDLQA